MDPDCRLDYYRRRSVHEPDSPLPFRDISPKCNLGVTGSRPLVLSPQEKNCVWQRAPSSPAELASERNHGQSTQFLKRRSSTGPRGGSLEAGGTPPDVRAEKNAVFSDGVVDRADAVLVLVEHLVRAPSLGPADHRIPE